MNCLWNVFWVMAMIGVVEPSKVSVIDMSNGSYESSLCQDYAENTYIGDGTQSGTCTSTTGCCYCEADGNAAYGSKVSGVRTSVRVITRISNLSLHSL